MIAGNSGDGGSIKEVDVGREAASPAGRASSHLGHTRIKVRSSVEYIVYSVAT